MFISNINVWCHIKYIRWVLAWITIGLGFTIIAAEKGWSLDKTSLTGSYVIYDIQAAFSSPDTHVGWGISESSSLSRVEITLDGSGSWSGSSTDYELERHISEVEDTVSDNKVLSNKFSVSSTSPTTNPISGTYALRRDGTGSISHPEGTEPIVVSPDGSIFIMGHREYLSPDYYAYVSMAVGVKKGSGHSNVSLNGDYVVYDLQSAYGSADSNGGWGVSDAASISMSNIAFYGNGIWNGSSTNYELERQMSEVLDAISGDTVLSNTFSVSNPSPGTDSISGTYSIDSDGTGTLTHPEGTEPIVVSPDGSIFVMGNRSYDGTNYYAYINMAVGVKKGSGHSNASLNGTYTIYNLQSAFAAEDTNGGWGVSDGASLSRAEITFDGTESWRGKSTNYELERQISEVEDAIGGDKVLSNTFTVLIPSPASDSISGTYAINSDGTGTVSHPEGTDPIIISPDGNLFLMGNRSYDASGHYAYISMAVGIKKSFAPLGIPNLLLLLGN